MKDPAALSKTAWSLLSASKVRKVTAGTTAFADESTEARRRLNELIIISKKYEVMIMLYNFQCLEVEMAEQQPDIWGLTQDILQTL